VRRSLPALAAVLATASGCCACAGSPTFVYRAPRARAPAAAPALAGPVLRALHLADFGDETCQQAAVASGVAEAHRRAPFDVALFPGDNLYECGPDPALPGAEACAFEPDGSTVAPGYAPPPDPRFARHEASLGALAAPPAEVFLALGNHDVATWRACGGGDEAVARRKACLEVAHRSPLWTMPGRHYVVDRGPARFIVLDSNLLERDYGGFTIDGEVERVRAAAAGCRPDDCAAEPGGCAKPWCFVVAHHPAYTAGDHRDDATPDYLARLDRILEAGDGRLRAWLAGHDHDLQHLRAPDGRLDVFVSGNGARARPRERFRDPSVPGTEVLFGSVRWGHGVLEASADGWRYRFEGADGAPLHCCAADGPGPCEPAACPSR
jgi:3',5'-cyclic AMP phosphodiesterase CpdA